MNPQVVKTIKVAGVSIVLASASLAAFLTNWEDAPKDRGKGAVVYADRLAGGLPTACRGITHHTADEPVIVGDYWSQEKCDRVIQKVIMQGQIGLAECFEVPLTQNQFDAFSAMAHNLGNGNVCASKAVGLVNAKRYAEGCRAIAYTPEGKPNWSMAGGNFVQGLHNRRLDEMHLCLKP